MAPCRQHLEDPVRFRWPSFKTDPKSLWELYSTGPLRKTPWGSQSESRLSCQKSACWPPQQLEPLVPCPSPLLIKTCLEATNRPLAFDTTISQEYTDLPHCGMNNEQSTSNNVILLLVKNMIWSIPTYSKLCKKMVKQCCQPTHLAAATRQANTWSVASPKPEWLSWVG